MKYILSFLLLILIISAGIAQDRQPILDVHLHAYTADQQGPPPVAMCTPIPEFPAWDPGSGPYGQVFMRLLKEPQCDDPVWSPETDQELMDETIRVMNEYNVFGVLSGTPDRVAMWMEAAPGRFIPGL